jgi:hypothetical protein
MIGSGGAFVPNAWLQWLWVMLPQCQRLGHGFVMALFVVPSSSFARLNSRVVVVAEMVK